MFLHSAFVLFIPKSKRFWFDLVIQFHVCMIHFLKRKFIFIL